MLTGSALLTRKSLKMTVVNKAVLGRCYRNTLTGVSWETAMCYFTYYRVQQISQADLGWSHALRECPPAALEMTNPEMLAALPTEATYAAHYTTPETAQEWHHLQ